MSRFARNILFPLLGKLLIVAILGFILMPSIVVAISAFDARQIQVFPPQEFSTRWFANAIEHRDFRVGVVNSLYVMLWTSTLALLTGLGFVLALNRYEFQFKRTLEMILMAPLVVPHFTVGLGILILVAQANLSLGFSALVFCHLVLVLPYVIRSIYVSFKNLDPRYELAAASLGASPRRVLGTVTIPLLIPGMVGGWLFAAILSFNEFTGSLFITNRTTQTLPVAMYSYVREYADPTLAAIAVIYLVITGVLLVVANYYLGLGKMLNVEKSR